MAKTNLDANDTVLPFNGQLPKMDKMFKPAKRNADGSVDNGWGRPDDVSHKADASNQ